MCPGSLRFLGPTTEPPDSGMPCLFSLSLFQWLQALSFPLFSSMWLSGSPSLPTALFLPGGPEGSAGISNNIILGSSSSSQLHHT